jgi:ubiquitin-large subunit ribosomal protein L40e
MQSRHQMVNLSPSVLNPKYSNFEIEEWEDEETEDDETSPSTPTQHSPRKMHSAIRSSPHLRPFPIFINTLRGKTITLSVRATSRVDEVRMMIARKEGVQPHRQQLLYAGKQLEDGRRISDYDIRRESTLILLVALPGGAGRDTVLSSVPCMNLLIAS